MTVKDEMIGADLGDVREGGISLLSVMEQHFMVELLEVTDDTVRTTFPGADYPLTGMTVDLEFHDKLGFNCYRTKVIEGPSRDKRELLLERPIGCIRTRHRDACRVDTDLTIQIKSQVHFRRYDADLVNLSVGGAMIESHAIFEMDETVEVTISLPQEPLYILLAQIVHIGNNHKEIMQSEKISYGIQFVGTTPEVSVALARYIWKRLRDLYN